MQDAALHGPHQSAKKFYTTRLYLWLCQIDLSKCCIIFFWILNAKDFKFNWLRLLIIVQPLLEINRYFGYVVKKIGDGNNSIATIKSTSFQCNPQHEKRSGIGPICRYWLQCVVQFNKTLVLLSQLATLF
jgi:hypothetical protein